MNKELSNLFIDKSNYDFNSSGLSYEHIRKYINNNEFICNNFNGIYSYLYGLENNFDGMSIYLSNNYAVLNKKMLEMFCMAYFSIIEKNINILFSRKKYIDYSKYKNVHNKVWNKVYKTEITKKIKVIFGVMSASKEEYDSIEKLRLLSNICRHENGKSYKFLSKKYPELIQGLDVIINIYKIEDYSNKAIKYFNRFLEQFGNEHLKQKT